MQSFNKCGTMDQLTDEEAVSATKVFWDIKECPVPPDFDARLVGPCIRRFLKKRGYSGPLTIAAIGSLTDVPDEVLRAISSTGIVCHNVCFGCVSVASCMFEWADRNPPPSNIMLITDPSHLPLFRNLDLLYHQRGHNIVFPYRYGPKKANADCPWTSFLLAESEALEEDECIETGEPARWVCQICNNRRIGLAGQGVENLTTHLSSEQHAQKLLRWIPPKPVQEEEQGDDAENWGWQFFLEEDYEEDDYYEEEDDYYEEEDYEEEE